MDGHPAEQPDVPIPQSASLSTSHSAQPTLTKTLYVRIPPVFPSRGQGPPAAIDPSDFPSIQPPFISHTKDFSHLSASRTPFSDKSPVPVLSHTEGLAGPSGCPIPPLFEGGLLPSVSNANQSDESGGKTLVDDASRIEGKEHMPRFSGDVVSVHFAMPDDFVSTVQDSGRTLFVDSAPCGEIAISHGLMPRPDGVAAVEHKAAPEASVSIFQPASDASANPVSWSVVVQQNHSQDETVELLPDEKE